MKKKILGFFIVSMMLCALAITVSADGVKPSTVNYNVFLNVSEDVFVCNEKEIGYEPGTEYFMTYTVKKSGGGPKQQGVVGTADYTRSYPYDGGGFMNYDFNKELLKEGYTYFLKFTITEDGYEYSVARATPTTEPEYVYLTMEWGKKTDKMQHFGVWFSIGKTNAELEKVRFYDREGNDLGVYVEKKDGFALKEGEYLKKNSAVPYRYDITVKKQSNVALGHAKLPVSSKVYMEYTVKSVEKAFTQEGIGISKEIKGGYPYSMLRYNGYEADTDGRLLLDVGAEYILCMERIEDQGFNVYVQKKKDGKTSIHTFNIKYFSKFDGTAEYFMLWFGEKVQSSFELTDVRFYDEKANDLGFQTNLESGITVRKRGPLEDYSYCEATYYCEETGNTLKLYKDKTLEFMEQGAVSTKGTYSINEQDMTVKIGKENKKYNFMYHKIVNEQEQAYKRLYNYNLTFVTGTKEEVPIQYFSNENGYYATRPENPELKGYEFVEWCLADGSKYDFDTIVTESAIVYAKFSGDGGVVYVSNEEIPQEMSSNLLFPIVVGAVLLITGGVVCAVLIGKKGKRNDGK